MRFVPQSNLQQHSVLLAIGYFYLLDSSSGCLPQYEPSQCFVGLRVCRFRILHVALHSHWSRETLSGRLQTQLIAEIVSHRSMPKS